MKVVLLLLFFSLIILVGCNDCVSQVDMLEERTSLEDTAKNECGRKALKYINHYNQGLNDWSVICYQENPLKFFEYPIK